MSLVDAPVLQCPAALLVVDQGRCQDRSSSRARAPETAPRSRRVGLLPCPGVDDACAESRPARPAWARSRLRTRVPGSCAASASDPPATICTSRSAAVRRVSMGLTSASGVKWRSYQSSGRKAGCSPVPSPGSANGVAPAPRLAAGLGESPQEGIVGGLQALRARDGRPVTQRAQLDRPAFAVLDGRSGLSWSSDLVGGAVKDAGPRCAPGRRWLRRPAEGRRGAGYRLGGVRLTFGFLLPERGDVLVDGCRYLRWKGSGAGPPARSSRPAAPSARRSAK